MLYSPLINKAMTLCYDIHKDQLDKGNVPYVFHPLHLAEQFNTEDLIIVALLHDCLEDSSMTTNDLLNLGFTEECVTAIDLLTRKKDMSYMQYIKSIKKNCLAKEVKLADLKHNLDLNRLSIITLEDRKRLNKYHKAINELLNYNDEYIENDIKELLNHANRFYAELMELHTYRFEEQIDHILPLLDNLVHCNLNNIASIFNENSSFIELQKDMQALLEDKKQLNFLNNLTEYDQMKIIFNLYEHGSDIHLYAYRLFRMYLKEGKINNEV